MERRTYLVKCWLLHLVVALMFLQLNPTTIKASSVVESFDCFRLFSFGIFDNKEKDTKVEQVTTSRENVSSRKRVSSDYILVSYDETQSSLEKKIQDKLHSLGISSSDKSLLKNSIDQLFIRKKILFNIKEFRELLKHINSELVKVLQNEIRSNTVYKGASRSLDNLGVWNIPFILENIDIIKTFSQDNLKNFLKISPKGEVEKLFEHLKAELKKQLLDNFETVARSVYETAYNMWVKDESSDFSAEEKYIQNTLLSAIKQSLVNTLNYYKSKHSVFSSINLDELINSLYSSKAQSIIDRKESLSPIKYTIDTEGTLSFDISDLKIRGNFDPELSTIYLYQTPESLDYSPNLLFLHGASTFTSNAASFIEIINRIKTSFYTDSVAADLPGSMGDKGIVSNKISDPLEISIFLDKWFQKENLRRNGSNVAFGRSLGSTFAFANAFYNHIYNRPSSVDMYMLTSFSNPLTMDYQLKAVQTLTEEDPSVVLVPGFEKHLMEFVNTFKKDLETIRQQNPELISSFGYNMLFVQGEADADGGETVFKDLGDFIDTYSPNASVYKIKDPLKNYPDIAQKFGSDNREASHFLLNGRANMDIKHLNIPEKFAPKFFDQSLEVMILQRAWLDFMIDLSPFVSDEIKISLSEKRTNYTGSNQKFSYLKKMLSDLSRDLPEKYGQNINLNLDHIVNEVTDTSSNINQTIETRIKRVINFIEQEYIRQKFDAGISNNTTVAQILLN